MKASVSWLREILTERVAPSAERDALLALSPEGIAERLTQGGLEVEGIHLFGAGTQGLVVAEVVGSEPHPSRAKLRLVTLRRGEGAPEETIVCGAPNVPPPGWLVCFAPVGTHLPAVGLTLEPKEIGGVLSAGMLCSERELGLALDSQHDEGIMVLLPGTARPGTPLRDAVPSVFDAILEISLTPNRPDGLGHVGLARELAALSGLTFGPSPREHLGLPSPREGAARVSPSVAAEVTVTIADTARCPRYAAAVIENAPRGASPLAARHRLQSLGVRPISVLVDVTNLAMLLFAQPMHAFDLDKVRGRLVEVRSAREGETLTTLDGVVRSLVPDDLVIADAEGPLALAGVMGGQGSEIVDSTTRVLFECAYFAPRGVRRSSRRHGLHTESSHRFERGVDPAGVPEALAEAVRWTLGALDPELSQLEAEGPSARSVAFGEAPPPAWMLLAGEHAKKHPPIQLREERMNALLGTRFRLEAELASLGRLGCEVIERRPEIEPREVFVVPPTHRPDLGMEADLIEEVIRVRGLDAVPRSLPRITPGVAIDRVEDEMRARVRRAAVEVGLSEAVLMGFVAPAQLEALGAPPAAVRLVNPLGPERSVMRTSLLPGLFDAVRRARRHGARDARLFATGARFLPPRPSGDPGREPHPSEHGGAPLPDEVPSFAAVLVGELARGLDKPRALDVWDAKGVALEIVTRATRRPAELRLAAARLPHLHPRGAAEIVVQGEGAEPVVVGSLGPLHPDVRDALDLETDVLVIELCLRALAREVGVSRPRFKPIPQLPAATRDVALVLPERVTAREVERAIAEAAGELCESVEVFDVFTGGSIPAGHRSLAFHVVYRDPLAATAPDKARTLTDAEVDQRHAAVVQKTHERFGATLRA
jgi:phenylalanyl-tRNA synthetase beta chain